VASPVVTTNIGAAQAICTRLCRLALLPPAGIRMVVGDDGLRMAVSRVLPNLYSRIPQNAAPIPRAAMNQLGGKIHA